MTEMENVLCFGSSEQLLSYDTTFQLGDFSRGRAGIGNYTLKTEHVSARIDLSEIAQLEVCDPDKIVESIRDNKFITERHGTYDNTSRVDIGLSRAEEIIANEMISFSPKMHTFTILGNNGKPLVAISYH